MTKRNSSIELLRIIAMLMIIILHFIGPYTMDNDIKNNYHVIHLFESFSIIGVNIFVIISSYFLMDKQCIKVRKIVDLLILVIFYGLLFFVISTISGIQQYSNKELLLTIFPFWASRRWFVLSYIVLYLLSPYLSKIFNSLKKNEYRNLLIIILFFMSIWPSFFKGGLRLDNGYGIISFIMIYALTGYIKRFHNHLKIKKTTLFMIMTLSIMIIYLLSIIKITDTYWDYNNIFNIISAFSIFLLFKEIKITSKIINSLSASSFSVFLIHSDYMMSNFFYENIMHRSTIILSNKLIFYIIFYALMTYVISYVIDIIRRKLFDMTINKLLSKGKYINKVLECK